MHHSMNCIRTGQVLIDTNLHSFILCNNCHKEYLSLQSFHEHLRQCKDFDKLFRPHLNIKYGNKKECDQLFGKTSQNIKKYLIYDFRNVQLEIPESLNLKRKRIENSYADLINNIEAELLDPRWYTDDRNDNRTTVVQVNITPSVAAPEKNHIQYDKLVEAVTPFVQFKENTDTNYTAGTVADKTNTNQQLELMSCPQTCRELNDTEITYEKCLSKGEETPIPKKTTYTHKETMLQQSNSTQDIQQRESTDKKCIKRPKIDESQTVLPSTEDLKSINGKNVMKLQRNDEGDQTLQLPATSNNKERQTAQILSKLQTLGLQIKRTSTNLKLNTKTDNKTLELLQKLRSKGMKIKILKQTSTSRPTGAVIEQQKGLPTKKSMKLFSNTEVLPIMNKDLTVRKLHSRFMQA